MDDKEGPDEKAQDELPLLVEASVGEIERLIEASSEKDDSSGRESAAAKKEKKTILAIDDVSLNLRAIKAILEEDFHVLLAKSGQEALKVLNDTEVDLILLDIEMPEMSGFDMLKELKRSQPLVAVPVIFVTAYATEGFIFDATELGANDYIIKPILPDVLKKKVQGALAGESR